MDAHRRLITSGGSASGVPDDQLGRWDIHPTGKVFAVNDNGVWVPVRYRGVSAFRLMDAFLAGADVRWVREVFRGYNVLRVWPYVDWPDGWRAPSNANILRFLESCISLFPGWKIELTLMTDDKEENYGWAHRLVGELGDQHFPNLVLEGGNEPLTHKNIQVERLYAALNASGYLWSSGLYEVEAQRSNRILPGHYGTAHNPREKDWARRGHDLHEYFNGDGPDVRHDPARKPWVGDEPIRPDQVPLWVMDGEEILSTGYEDYRAYGGVVSLLGAGGTFHYAGGRQHQRPTEWESVCKDALLEGLTAFPANAPLGPYNRIVEPGQHLSARTYTVGPWMVRVWQQGAPPEGWVKMDEDGVLCRRA